MEINDELIKQWEPKVQRMASNVYIVGLDREDLAQELRLAIVKAAKGFELMRTQSGKTEAIVQYIPVLSDMCHLPFLGVNL